MIKIIYNNMIIDVTQQDKYVRYLPKTQRYVMSDKQTANAILGSDNDTIYHLQGTDFNFPIEVKTVSAVQIGLEEYDKLSTELMFQNQQTQDLRNEVNDLKTLVNKQNDLLMQLLAKLN